MCAIEEQTVESHHVEFPSCRRVSSQRRLKERAGTDDRVCMCETHTGKGITDQNRNILSNQLLILAFLRSAAKFLALGRTPSVHESRKRKKKSSDDGEGDSGHEDEPPDNLELLESRGTILITLRNVPPYTLW
jgi:25S rRNA (uracil2634-N3)-methyltransferase